MAVDVKTLGSLAYASVKTKAGVAVANIKSINGVDTTGGFLPTDIAGLMFWGEADFIPGLNDGDPVSTFPDDSGNANDATSSGTARPLYRTNILNGYPAMEYDGSNDNMFSSFTRTNNDTDILLFLSNDVSANRSVVEANSTNVKRVFWTSSGNFVTAFNGGFLANTSTASGNWMIMSVRWDGASAELVVNGNSQTANVGSSTANGLWIGSSSGHSSPLQGYLVAALNYNSILSDSDEDLVAGYLRDKYGL